MKQNQNGFSPIFVIILIVVLAGIGFAGYKVMSNKAANKMQRITTAQQPEDNNRQLQKVKVEYEGWKSYKATTEKVGFKYPADWTVATGNDAPRKSAGFESIMLLAPTRTIGGKDYRLSLLFRIYTPNDPAGTSGNQTVLATDKLKSSTAKGVLSTVIIGSDNNLGKAALIDVGEGEFTVGSKTTTNVAIQSDKPDQIIEMGASYEELSNRTLAYFPTAEFNNLEDVKTVKMIFNSITQ